MNYKTGMSMLCVMGSIYAQDVFVRHPWAYGLQYTVDRAVVTPRAHMHGYESMRTLYVSRAIIPFFIKHCGRIVHAYRMIDQYDGSSYRSQTPNCGDCRAGNINDWYGYRPDWRGCAPLLLTAGIYGYRNRATIKEYAHAGYTKVVDFLHNAARDQAKQSPAPVVAECRSKIK